MAALLVLLAIIALVVASALYEWLLGRRFLEEWAAIDDDEFVRRCTPGTRRETALRIRRIVADQLDLTLWPNLSGAKLR